MAAAEFEIVRNTKDATPRQLLMTPEQAILSGEKFRRDEQIPISSLTIEDDAFIIDQGHVRDLVTEIKRDGQSVRIFVAVDRDPKTGKKRVRVLDGLHRASALLQIPEIDTAKVTAFYNLSDEEIFAQRVIAANSVGSVQVPRLITWMRNAFNNSEWSDLGLTLTQVYGMVSNNTRRSNLINISPERLEALKQWAKDKAGQWKKPPGSMYKLLYAVDNADPELVKEVRESPGGRGDHPVVITIDRLKAVANAFPKEENFAIQRAILDFVQARKLDTKQTQVLAEALRQHVQSGQVSMDELAVLMDELLQAMPADVVTAAKRIRTDKLERRISFLERQLEESRVGEGDVARLRQEIAELQEDLKLETAESGRLRREYMVLDNQFKAARRGAQDGALEPHRDDNGDLRSPSGMLLKTGREFQLAELGEQIERLRTANEALSAKTKLMEQGKVGWWEDIGHTPYLTEQERDCLRALTAENGSLDGFASHLRMPVELIVKTAIGAIKKRWDTEKRIQAVGDGAW